jgi:hypothetical protein
MDQEWEDRKSTFFTRTGPYEFRNNTDYRDGWTLETEEDVFEFFRKNSELLRPEELGNAYECQLLDHAGEPCWVEVSHRGEKVLA